MNSTLLDIVNVSLTSSHINKPILSNINYQVQANDFIIILGSNGSGKSSLLKLIDRRYHSSSGNILLNKKRLSQFTAKEYSKKVITITQNCHDSLFTSLTVLENYLLLKQRHDRSLFNFHHTKERAFFSEYLQEFNANLSDKLDQIVDKLSGGEKQALTLALSVLYPPEILLLDEHTSALDPKSAEQLMMLTQRVIQDHHITCLLTTHDLDIAIRYGNRILALKQGTIFKTIDTHHKQTVSQQDLLDACY